MVLQLSDFWSNWNLEMLGFEEMGKPENPKKDFSEQGVWGESTTSLHPTKLTCISFAWSISVFSFMHTLCIYIPSHRTLPRCTNTGLNASLRWKKFNSLSHKTKQEVNGKISNFPESMLRLYRNLGCMYMYFFSHSANSVKTKNSLNSIIANTML